jgi:hypothetical protein
MATEITLKQAAQKTDDLKEKWRKAAVLGLQSAAARGVQDIITRIIPSRTPQPVDRGIYRSGWRFYPSPDGAVIECFEPHAILIEDGVRAGNVKIGRAMINALAEWVKRKGIVSADEAEGVAWAIAKKMQERGIFGRGKGLGILRELVDKYLPGYVDEEVAREVEKAGF